MSVEFEASYEVAKKMVRLSVIIGDAQLGSSRVMLDNKEIGRGQINKLEVGMGPKIRGSILSVKTVVTDVNDQTNRTSVRYVLTGGRVDQEFDLNAMVDHDGASIVYRAKFNLV